MQGPQRREDATRFGTVRMNESARIEEFEEKPMVTNTRPSLPNYVIRRRLLISNFLLSIVQKDERHDFVTNILIRYKNLKKIYGYKMNGC